MENHADLFIDELGLAKHVEAKIHIDPDATPRFHRPRPVPYALRPKVEEELKRLEKEGVIEPVQFVDWAAPIVPIVKQDGTVRICGDYKVTINRASKLDTYPLPRVEDLFAALGNGKSFTKLDLAHAYQQIKLDEASRDLTVINTHKGLYRYNRLPFGVSSAPAIFQRIMEGILQGIPNVAVYIDDILVTGKTDEEHLDTLDRVLTRLQEKGLRLKKRKCEFMRPSVEYLGHIISAEGLRPTQEKVRAINDAPAPQNVTQLRSFVGLVNFYSKFLPNLATRLAPLYHLLQKEAKWCWEAAQKKSFKEAKAQLSSSALLAHYDPSQELLLTCDASPYGVGAVLSHRLADGNDKPVAFASRSLAAAEKKYAQIEKEGLAIVFGVKRFHQYLAGRKFTINSDHKPLQTLFSETRPVPVLASARIQRWAQLLGAYDYVIAYKPGDQLANADSLSRLPLPEAPMDVPVPGETILLMSNLQDTPVTAKQVKSWTDRDPQLARVRLLVQKGWSDTDGEDLPDFRRRKAELSVQDGCILWGSRVVIPTAGRIKIMEELHESHPGIVRMKSLARSYVWWPGMDKDLETKVAICSDCQRIRKSPPPAMLHPWEWPTRPWARLHVDYAGPFMGKMFLVVVDAHSKWMNVVTVVS